VDTNWRSVISLNVGIVGLPLICNADSEAAVAVHVPIHGSPASGWAEVAVKGSAALRRTAPKRLLKFIETPCCGSA
jgi:hypothetical protein